MEMGFGKSSDLKVQDFPSPPPPQVVHKHDVTWIASWTDPILSHPKYVFLAASSAFKMRSDMEKFEKARRLGVCLVF